MVTVEVEGKALEQSASGAISGTVWWQFDDVAFPEREWSDFVVTVLGWWTHELAALVGGSKRNGELLFMDGPYSVGVTVDGERARIECRRRRRGGSVREHQATAGVAELASAMIHAADVTLDRCTQAGWQSNDIAELRRGRQSLADAAEKAKTG